MTVRIAMVGCGAIAERGHLPAVQAAPDCNVTMLVDADRERASELAAACPGANASQEYRDVIGQADAAILALPHHLHAEISCALLEAGVHVLIEKPMALSVAECEQMIAAAETGKAVLAVGLMRRFLHSARYARWAVQSGLLGTIESFDFQEGNVYNWRVQSDFFFRKETAGGGVLFDTGAHTLDLLLWWLGDVAEATYYDDSYGGVEADCRLELTMANGMHGEVHLSRTRDLRNTAIIRGDKAELEVDLRANWVALRDRDGSVGHTGPCVDPNTGEAAEQRFADLFHPQVWDWLEAIRSGRAPTVPGSDALASIRLIEQCYQSRRPLVLPWMQFNKEGSAV